MFGDAISYTDTRIFRRRWWPLQPANVCMAPDGHLWFSPHGDLYRNCFAGASLSLQAFFLHEMVHVWQAQTRGRWWLPLRRHPFCRYAYRLEPGKPFLAYGIEQQAEIVRHAYLLRRGVTLPGRAPLAAYEAILPFSGTGSAAGCP